MAEGIAGLRFDDKRFLDMQFDDTRIPQSRVNSLHKVTEETKKVRGIGVRRISIQIIPLAGPGRLSKRSQTTLENKNKPCYGLTPLPKFVFENVPGVVRRKRLDKKVWAYLRTIQSRHLVACLDDRQANASPLNARCSCKSSPAAPFPAGRRDCARRIEWVPSYQLGLFQGRVS